jgi:sigma-B regulation protein RsbU (phosphoserine phosphatase)
LLELRHFLRLPELDPLVERLIADGPGLTVVAGLDPRPHAEGVAEGFLPSGRAGVLRILLSEILAARPAVGAIAIVEDERSIRAPRGMERRVRVWGMQPSDTYQLLIDRARSQRPDMLVIDHLGPENVQQVLDAARHGVRVLSQLDTVLCGADVVRQLLEFGASASDLEGLSWVVSVQRFAMLCPACRKEVVPDPVYLDRVCSAHPHLTDQVRSAVFYQPGACAACQHTGRKGSVAAFDLYRVPDGPDAGLTCPSLLSREQYVLGLALRGHLALEDVVGLGGELLRRTYALLTAEEKAVAHVHATLQRKVAELETANRVLQHRTEALISLQDMAQTLISSTELGDLAARVCRYAGDLCGADRVVLYYGLGNGEVRVLATRGWDPAAIGRVLGAEAFAVSGLQAGEPVPYAAPPPGVGGSVEPGLLRTGLCVPLVAQGELVGLMIVHATRKDVFTPGEIALLETFATQSALSIQRAGLIDQLRLKIAQLEAAQAELVQKERLEHELELARQVQQSVLPRVFPPVPGYAFAARNRPARQVGGDFYDLFSLDDDHLGIVIADVSDKGMPAALYMALTRSLLLAEARREMSPRTTLAQVNRLLIELGRPNMFVTVFYGVLQVSTGQLTYVRAGHDRPLLLHDGNARLLTGAGAALGILGPDQLRLSAEQTVLRPGDRLVLYTDGLTDVIRPDGQLYDLARFQALLLSHKGLGADAFCDAVFADLAAYQGSAEQYDDMTMLVVEVR